MAVEIGGNMGYAGNMTEGSNTPEEKIAGGNLVGKDVLYQPAVTHAVPEDTYREIKELNSSQVEADSGLKASKVEPLKMNERDEEKATADTGRTPPGLSAKSSVDQSKRQFLIKGGLAGAGLLATVAGLFGLDKLFRRAVNAPGPDTSGTQTRADQMSADKRMNESNADSIKQGGPGEYGPLAGKGRQ